MSLARPDLRRAEDRGEDAATGHPAGSGGGSASAVVLVVGLVLVAGYLLLRSEDLQDFGYGLVGVLSVVVMIAGIGWRRPAERLGWSLLAAAYALFLSGDGVYGLYHEVWHRAAPFPSVADALYLLGYPLLFLGVARVTRLRSAAGAREVRADAAMVALGALALSWHLLMGHDADNASLTAFGKLVALAYPVMDIAVLYIVASAMMARAARRRADTLVALAIGVMVPADFVFDLQVRHSDFANGGLVQAAFLVTYVLMAAAAVHPSVAEPLPAEPAASRRAVWTLAVAGAAFVAPGLIVICTIEHTRVDVGVLSAISIVVSALAALRASWLYKRLRQQSVELARRGESLQAALAAQQALESDLRHQAFHDSLTGLPNRALLHDRVDHALAASARSHGTVAVCFCDLDGFKAVNDGAGHEVGDQVLVAVSKRIASLVRPGDTVARVGGDEFVVLVSDVDDTRVATALAERIVSVLREPLTIDGRQVYVSASVGIAIAKPGATSHRLVAEADTAMYDAKRSGKDRVAVFEAHMWAHAFDRMLFTNAFQESLRDGRFHLEYQPQAALADGTLEGFEALLRWRHPSLGTVGPERFVSIAEETGFIVSLGRWVLAEACAEAARWVASGTPIPISVNVSGRQLQDAGIVEDVRAALASSGLPAGLLVLEVTESVLVVDPQDTLAVLRELKRIGVRIAIDDFGTGYSSLSSLRQFPTDIVKIDKTFVDPLNDPASEARALVRMILRLAAELNLEVTAEGIEHEIQREILTQLGCRRGQGFLISRPLPGEAARALLQARTPLH